MAQDPFIDPTDFFKNPVQEPSPQNVAFPRSPFAGQNQIGQSQAAPLVSPITFDDLMSGGLVGAGQKGFGNLQAVGGAIGGQVQSAVEAEKQRLEAFGAGAANIGNKILFGQGGAPQAPIAGAPQPEQQPFSAQPTQPSESPVAGQQAVITPAGGGQVSMPQSSFDQIQDQRMASEEDKLRANAQMQQRIKESGARFQTNKILEEMRGTGSAETDIDKIKKEIGAVATSPDQALAMLRNRQTALAADASLPGNQQVGKRVRERLAANVKTKTLEDGSTIRVGIGGQAADLLDFADSVGSDPTSDKTNLQYMSSGDRREFRRGLEDLSRKGDPIGARRINKRLNAIKGRVEKKRESEIKRGEAKRVAEQAKLESELNLSKKSEELTQLRAKAGSDQEKQRLDQREAEFDLLMEKYKTSSGKDKRNIKEQIQAFDYGVQAGEGVQNVQMVAPDGRSLSVPADRVDEMVEKGARTI